MNFEKGLVEKMFVEVWFGESESMEEGGKYGYTRLPMCGFLFNHHGK